MSSFITDLHLQDSKLFTQEESTPKCANALQVSHSPLHLPLTETPPPARSLTRCTSRVQPVGCTEPVDVNKGTQIDRKKGEKKGEFFFSFLVLLYLLNRPRPHPPERWKLRQVCFSFLFFTSIYFVWVLPAPPELNASMPTFAHAPGLLCLTRETCPTPGPTA